VGCTLPLNTGTGVETKKMLEMIVSNFNGEGGIVLKGQRYTIDLIIYDDKYTAEAGRAAVERLVYQDKVKFIVGQIGSAPILAGLAISEPEKVINFSAGISTKIVDPRNRFTFGTSTSRTSIPSLWHMVKKVHPNAKTVVLISPDDETGRARAEEEAQVAQAHGVKVLQALHFPRNTVDFSSIALKAKSYNPDLVDYPGMGVGTQFGLLLKAMHAAGFKGGHVSGLAPVMEEVAAVASPEAMEGLLCKAWETDMPNPSKIALALKQDYLKKYGGKWTETSFTWISSWYAFIAALRAADSVDPTVVASTIATKGMSWELPNGTAILVKRPDLKNNRYVDTCASLSFAQLKKGKPVFIGKVSLDESITACEKVFGGKWR
jgi:branched-chain amino acid transport system substrate-binding protein